MSDSPTTSTPSRRAVLVRLTEADYEAVADAAAETDTSKSAVIRGLVRTHFGAIGSGPIGNL